MSVPLPDPVLAVFQQQEAERDVRREIETALVELVRTQERLDAVRKQLARKPAWEREAESFLGPAVEERARVARRLGFLLAEWRLSGGELNLAHPHDELRVGPGAPPAQPLPPPIPEAPPTSELVSEILPEPIAAPADDAVPSPAPTISPEQIAAFKERFLKGASEGTLLTKSPTSATWRTSLEQLLAFVGRPPNPMNEREHEHEVEVLDAGTDAAHVAVWRELPQEAQRGVMGLFVSRARALKDIAALRLDLRTQIKEIMPRFPAFASEVRPGHVNGLRVEHRPVRNTWHADALAAWDYLHTLLPDEDAPALISRTEATRPKAKKREDEEAEPEKREIVPADWPGWTLTRGAHAVIVGGEPREPARERLEEVFAFGELEWISSDATRKHDALVERIASGKVELVLIIQTLVNHKTSDKLLDAAKQRRVPWALIGGYGASVIQQGVERYLERKVTR